MEKIIKEKMRLLLERFRKGPCVIQDSQEVLFWKGDLKLLEGREETSFMGVLKGAFQAEGIYGGPTGTKKLGVTEELEGQGGQNTRVKGIGTGMRLKVGQHLEGFMNECGFGCDQVQQEILRGLQVGRWFFKKRCSDLCVENGRESINSRNDSVSR